MIFAYFGPETLLPATSVFAAVSGVLLMFGRGSLRVTLAVVRKNLRRPSADESEQVGTAASLAARGLRQDAAEVPHRAPAPAHRHAEQPAEISSSS